MSYPIPFAALVTDKRFHNLNYENFQGKYSEDENKLLYGYILVTTISPYTGSNKSSILYYKGSLTDYTNKLITYKFTRKPSASLSCVGINITISVITHKIASIKIIDSYYEEKELLLNNTLFGAYINSLGIYSNADDTLAHMHVSASITEELIKKYATPKYVIGTKPINLKG